MNRRALIILYEDSERTMKFVEQMSTSPLFEQVRLGFMNAGINCGTISLPEGRLDNSTNATQSETETFTRDMLFSRCSGSYSSRGHLQSPAIIESIIFTAENSKEYLVFNGCKAFQLEMNKMLAFLYIASNSFHRHCRQISYKSKKMQRDTDTESSNEVHLRVPPTIAVTRLTDKIVQHAISKAKLEGECFIKGLVGGGSTTVRRLHVNNDENNKNHSHLTKQLKAIRQELDPENKADSVFILQGKTPSTNAECQYRFELIDKKVHYVVRIQRSMSLLNVKTQDVENLCMCDLNIDDPDVQLSIIKTAKQLSKEPGMQRSNGDKSPLQCAHSVYSSIELFAQVHELHVVALEGTLHNGVFWTFDINTNSNYNEHLEKQHNVIPGAWRVLETMLNSTGN